MDTRPTAEDHAGHERSDANVETLVKFAVGLFVSLVLVLFAMRALFRYFATVQSMGPPASPFADARPLPPRPQLQVEPILDLKQLRQAEDEKLDSYGWVDQKAGIVRIPIERAMDLVIQRGLPVRRVGESSGLPRPAGVSRTSKESSK